MYRLLKTRELLAKDWPALDLIERAAKVEPVAGVQPPVPVMVTVGIADIDAVVTVAERLIVRTAVELAGIVRMVPPSVDAKPLRISAAGGGEGVK